MFKWKNWIFLLTLSLLVTGCNSPSNEEKAKEKEKAKAQSKPPKQTALQKLGDNKMEVVLFLNRAEHALEEVYYSALENAKGKTVHEDSLSYRELPKRFDSKDKIVGYFSRFWSKPLAEALYDNMSTKLVKDKVYVSLPHTDYPAMISVRNTNVQKLNGDLNVTVENAADATVVSDRTIRYHLVRDKKTKRYEIKSRNGTYGSENFQ
ncbi:hypothetical protein BRE01_26250 [Brevibacillus reuszeri]|uniref:Lipoprotein n=1 Tax=Brevibacillus reuszeri TaxID=54915 RepID=A0A0K9YLX9_9BACL|nr:hypothetical protein [Brevibacillus reuszeri]KNB69743.1 hypothetical protein ADS79_28255 [Brevibacillus reuszeri]MED1858085.1 hypothetical protein [Brevibacillus reuszeri]GED68923.1 hypothetical protein BRE01_26250 [Brevibacillus reuszeri]